MSDIKELIGKTVVKVERNENVIKFYCNDESLYLMWHEQDCCESVYIEDINGDLNDLVGLITDAREASGIVTYDEK